MSKNVRKLHQTYNHKLRNLKYRLFSYNINIWKVVLFLNLYVKRIFR